MGLEDTADLIADLEQALAVLCPLLLRTVGVCEHVPFGFDLRVGSKVYRGRMVLMRVSELAERSGVAATTLRYYEERGLLPAQRPPAGRAARLLGAPGPDPVKEN